MRRALVLAAVSCSIAACQRAGEPEPLHPRAARPGQLTLSTSADFLSGANVEYGLDVGTDRLQLQRPTWSLGSFTQGTQLPFHADPGGQLLAVNGNLYLLGALTHGAPSNQVSEYFAPIVAPGTIGSWTLTGDTATHTIGNCGHGGYQAYNGRLYCFGVTDYMASIDSQSGALSPWTALGAGASANDYRVSGNHAYALINGNPPIVKYSGFKASDGSLTGWLQATAYSGQSQTDGILYATDNRLCAGGGISKTNECAPIQPDGSLGTWSATTLPDFRFRGSTLQYGGTLLVLGGEFSSDGSSADVDGTVASLGADGSVGAWASFTNPYGQYGTFGSFPLTVYQGQVYLAEADTSNHTTVVAAPLAPDTPPASLGSVGSWSSPTSVGLKRQSLAAVASNGYLYATGGVSIGIAIGETRVSKLTNGVPGNFTAAANTFATARYNHAAVAAGGRLYVIGGSDSSGTPLDDVQFAPLSSTTGLPSAFSSPTANKLPAARTQHAAVVVGNHLYVLGGATAGTPSSNDVLYATINSDGSLGTFASTTGFTTGRIHLAAFAYNGSIYVTGGFDGANALSDVQRATPAADGSISAWTATSSFTTGRYGHAALAMNGFAWVIGGNGAPTDAQAATFNLDGSLGAWAPTTALPAARIGPGFAAADGTLYVIGGSDGSNEQTTVYTASAQVPMMRGAWSKLVDFKAQVTSLDSIQINGTAGSRGTVRLEYETAGSAGTFDARIDKGVVPLGTPVAIAGAANVRYVWLRLTLDESQSGVVDPAATDDRDVTGVVLNVTTNPASAIAFATTAQTIHSATCSAKTTVHTVDSGSAEVTASADVTVALSGNPAATFYSDAGCSSAVTSVVISAGQTSASFYFKEATAGTLGVTATPSGGGLSAAVTQNQTIQVGPEVAVAFKTQPGNVQAGHAIAPAVEVAFVDAGGNLVTSDNISNVTISADPSYSGTLSGTLSATAVNGVASFANLKLDTAGTGAILKAVANGWTAVASNPFNVVTGPTPSKLAFTTPARTVQVDTCSDVVTVETEKSDGAALSAGVAVTVAVSGASLFSDAACGTPEASLTIPASASSVSFYFKPDATGTLTLSVTATNLSEATQDETVTATAPPDAGPDGGAGSAADSDKTLNGFSCSQGGGAGVLALLAALLARRRRPRVTD